MACLPRFTWVDPHPCEPEQQMRCCRWWGGASGGVRVPIRLHRGPGRSRPFTSQSLTTRLMGGAGGNDSSGKPYPSTASHDSGLHSTNHLASSTATTTGGEDSCPMKGDESQPREGWMVRTPPAPFVPRRRARLREPTISTLDGSRTPPGAGCRGSTGDGATCTSSCACSTFPSTFNRFGFARMVPLGTLGCEPSPASP